MIPLSALAITTLALLTKPPLATAEKLPEYKGCAQTQSCKWLGTAPEPYYFFDARRWWLTCTDRVLYAALEFHRAKTNTSFVNLCESVSHYFKMEGEGVVHCHLDVEEGAKPCVEGPVGSTGHQILNGLVGLHNSIADVYKTFTATRQQMLKDRILNHFANVFFRVRDGEVDPFPEHHVRQFATIGVTMALLNNMHKAMEFHEPWHHYEPEESGGQISQFLAVYFKHRVWKVTRETPVMSDESRSIEAQLKRILVTQERMLIDIHKDLFSGSETSVSLVRMLIESGKFTRAKKQNLKDLASRIKGLFYAMLVPYAWRVSEKHQVLIDTGIECSSDPKFWIWQQSQWRYGSKSWRIMGGDLSVGTVDTCFIDKRYVLAAPTFLGPSRKCGFDDGYSVPEKWCKLNMTSLPGDISLYPHQRRWHQTHGDSQFWGEMANLMDGFLKQQENILRDRWQEMELYDLVASAVYLHNATVHKNNHRLNGDPWMMVSPVKLERAADDMVLPDFEKHFYMVHWHSVHTKKAIFLPGLIDIPICSMETIRKNWAVADVYPRRWPCDAPYNGTVGNPQENSTLVGYG
ncbi:Killer toxin subunits alpha/beta [Ophiocordyceps camponoti-floridani]|uniref:Killer toxin subunits alpha/beta n=1 Tax=Ophiocordyceps camponoti-floridani TaxID=2030778 RepID=A0A8H4VAL8_9HYPO|nr:Killer toxin subunits alpha/beta [Ophiocordyceps camponoti-floridani]